MIYTIEFEQERDGRWTAEIPSLPGVMAYGNTREEAQVIRNRPRSRCYRGWRYAKGKAMICPVCHQTVPQAHRRRACALCGKPILKCYRFGKWGPIRSA